MREIEMGYKFETKELKTRVVSCVVCAMIAMFCGVGALAFMLITHEFLIGGILVVVFIIPIIIWRIIYSVADANIYKRIAKAENAVEVFAIVERCSYFKNSKKDNSGKRIYLTSVLTGDESGDKIPYRLYESDEQFERGDFVLIRFIKEQYQTCLIVRKAAFEEYKAQFPQEYWGDYDGDGSDLLFNDEEDEESAGQTQTDIA